MELLRGFRKPRFVQVVLPVGREYTVTTSCRVVATGSNALEALVFNADVVADFINLSRECYISYQDGDKVSVLQARIKEVSSEQKLHLEAIRVRSREQAREYYRINTRVDLRCWPASGEKKPAAWQRDALVNLGGGGIKFSTISSVDCGEKLRLEIHLPGEKPCAVRCGGIVKRVKQIAHGRKSLAVQFAGIRPEDRESIVRFCFSRQLEQLRNQSLVPHYDDYLLEVLGF